MGAYKKCSVCGASLDFGENCNCEFLETVKKKKEKNHKVVTCSSCAFSIGGSNPMCEKCNNGKFYVPIPNKKGGRR